VFVSSVVSTLEREREAICKLVASLGWECDASGISETRFWGGAEDSCYRRVERSDLYIGIFCSRSGSPAFAHEAFITETEFYTALNFRRPMRIYVLQRAGIQPDENLKHFIDCMETDLYIRRCTTTSQLELFILQDLEEFERCWLEGDTSSLVPPLHLDQALRHIGIFAAEAATFNLTINEREMKGSKELVEVSVSAMEAFYQRDQFAEAAALGADLMLVFPSLGLSYRNKELVLLWARFLQMWAGSCIWNGYIAGRFGALNSSLLMREAYRMLEDWGRFHESYGLVANSYYVLASRMHVREARLGNVKTFVDVTSEQRSALKRALIFDEVRAFKYSETFPHLHRAYVNLELGNYPKAIADFRTMLGYGDVLRERMYLDYLTGLGQALVLEGLRKELQTPISEGRSMLREAEAGLEKFIDSPYYLSYMKRIAKSLIRIGDSEAAKAQLLKLYPLAVKKRLTHQAEGIGALLTSLNPKVNPRRARSR